jgi:hypothetical protein
MEKEAKRKNSLKKKKADDKKAIVSAPIPKIPSSKNVPSIEKKKDVAWSFSYFDAILAFLVLLIIGIVIYTRKRTKA